ncbi:hypothetical protein Sliba_01960 [Streptomyces nigrescens]|uniref:Uncharacterized protein n=1 Tax=Streptomyces nigrescens TaxID=1920 RepID=A0A640T7N0_STRNI|nr:hypothetical protein Sliba_01960 [Streptomyces libani subsp. libani]GGW04129.1 hypothetical protein GCM10010500_65440 [Streptomyces libani subsp. libani]
MQMREQRVHRRGPRPRGTADGIPDTDDAIADVPTGQRLLFLVRHSPGLTDRPSRDHLNYGDRGRSSKEREEAGTRTGPGTGSGTYTLSASK